MWEAIFNTLKALGVLIGIIKDAASTIETQSDDSTDATAARNGTAAGAAAYSAGKSPRKGNT